MTKPDVEGTKLRLQDLVHVLTVLGGVYEAARTVQPWGLLDGGCYRSGGRSGLGDGVVDLVPNEGIVWIVGEGCLEERFDAVAVEVVGGGRRNEL